MPLDKRKYMESLLTETEAEFKEFAFLSHTAFYTNHLAVRVPVESTANTTSMKS